MKSDELPLPALDQSGAVPLAALLARVQTPGRSDWSDIPAAPGIYTVFLPEGVPFGVAPGTPAEEAERIRDKWERIGAREPTDVLYIGKAENLRQALRALARFGACRRGAPRGGEWLWLVEPIRSAWVRWAECAPGKQNALKATLLACFLEAHGEWPLANRRYR